MSITLDPKPGFVLKTRVIEAQSPLKHSPGTKVFINVCHDSQAPRPPQDFDPAVVYPLIILNEWEIPLIVSEEKATADKKGIPSFVYDCCVNSLCFQWCQVNSDLRQILNEWCLEAVELMYEMTLDRDYSVPKMLSKGELSSTTVPAAEMEGGFQKKLQQLKQNDTLGLIEELKPETERNEGDLPDLMDVNRKHQRPLIEEIGLMTIELREQEEGAKETNSEMTAKPTRSKGGDDETTETRPILSLTTSLQNIETLPYQLLVKLTTDGDSDLGGNLELQLDMQAQVLEVRPAAQAPFALAGRKLQIPVPARVVESSQQPKSFFVPPQRAVYTFL